MNDGDLWKRRFHQISLLRLGCLAIFLLGIAIIFSDLLRPGGWPQPGAFFVIGGALGSVLGPKLLKRRWDRS